MFFRLGWEQKSRATIRQFRRRLVGVEQEMVDLCAIYKAQRAEISDVNANENTYAYMNKIDISKYICMYTCAWHRL